MGAFLFIAAYANQQPPARCMGARAAAGAKRNDDCVFIASTHAYTRHCLFA